MELNSLVYNYNFDLYRPIDQNGLTMLHYAVQSGQKEIVEALCTAMAEMNGINIMDNLGRTPLHYAASKGDVAIMKTLILAGCDVNSKTVGGETPLMKAIMFNKVSAVLLLLRYGGDIRLLDKSGTSSKEMAMSTKNTQIKMLIGYYEEIMNKLCLILYVYMYLQTTDRQNSLHKLSPDMIKQLTRYIIP